MQRKGEEIEYLSDISEEQWVLIKEHFDTWNYGKSRKRSQCSSFVVKWDKVNTHVYRRIL